MTAIDILQSSYLDGLVLPARNKLWVIVQEAHDYLHQLVNDPSSKVHPKYGEVLFAASIWGEQVSPTECCVCLAGLWYLRKESKLLGQETGRIPVTSLFLDALLDLEGNKNNIERWLGIKIPASLIEESACSLLLDTTNPHHIQDFLSWLLNEHTLNR